MNMILKKVVRGEGEAAVMDPRVAAFCLAYYPSEDRRFAFLKRISLARAGGVGIEEAHRRFGG